MVVVDGMPSLERTSWWLYTYSSATTTTTTTEEKLLRLHSFRRIEDDVDGDGDVGEEDGNIFIE